VRKPSTDKVRCTTCGAWIAQVSPITGEIVRSRWWGGTHFRDGTAEYQEAGADPTDFTHAKAWCRHCKKWWRWPLKTPTE